MASRPEIDIALEKSTLTLVGFPDVEIRKGKQARKDTDTMTIQKSIKSKAAIVDVCQERINGIQTYAPAKGTIPCAGTAYTAAALVAIYQKCIDTRLALVGIRHQEAIAMQERDAADTARKAVDEGLIQWAVNAYGPQSPQAKGIGYVPRTATPPTAQVRAEATAKAKATRAARGTTGKKAKKAITGATATAAAAAPVTPVTTPATTPATKA